MAGFDPSMTRISIDEAKRNAHRMLKLGFILGLMAKEDSKGATLSEFPTPIHDLNGEILFYEYQIIKDNRNIGSVIVAGNKLVGTPVVMLRPSPRPWDYDKMKDEAILLAEKLGEVRDKDVKFICYSHSQICAMVHYLDSNKKDIIVLFELPNMRVLTIGPEQPGGVTSYLDYIPKTKYSSILENFDETSNMFHQNFDSLPYDESLGINQPHEDLYPGILPLRKVKYVEFCIHGRNHNCSCLHAQKTDYYCSIAVMQMILCFWRYYYEQNDLAGRFGVTPTNLPNPTRQVDMYDSILNQATCPQCGNNLILYQIDKIETSINSSTYWGDKRHLISTVMFEVNHDRPCKIGVVGHALAIFGYIHFGLPSSDFTMFYILDPWPCPSTQSSIPTLSNSPQGGDIRWEVPIYWYEPNTITIKRR
jgi:hypothetical protein